MSCLLYLHGVTWSTFEAAFSAKSPPVAAVVKNMNVPHLRQYVFPKLTDEKAAAMVTQALTKGIDYDGLPSGDARLLDVIVDRAFMTRKLGIKTTPLSPMGVGAEWLDGLRKPFEAHGAGALWRMLRNGRRLGQKPEKKATENARFLLSPDEVQEASKQLDAIAEDEDELFGSELSEPFAKAAKKKLGLHGTWG